MVSLLAKLDRVRWSSKQWDAGGGTRVAGRGTRVAPLAFMLHALAALALRACSHWSREIRCRVRTARARAARARATSRAESASAARAARRCDRSALLKKRDAAGGPRCQPPARLLRAPRARWSRWRHASRGNGPSQWAGRRARAISAGSIRGIVVGAVDWRRDERTLCRGREDARVSGRRGGRGSTARGRDRAGGAGWPRRRRAGRTRGARLSARPPLGVTKNASTAVAVEAYIVCRQAAETSAASCFLGG